MMDDWTLLDDRYGEDAMDLPARMRAGQKVSTVQHRGQLVLAPTPIRAVGSLATQIEAMNAMADAQTPTLLRRQNSIASMESDGEDSAPSTPNDNLHDSKATFEDSVPLAIREAHQRIAQLYGKLDSSTPIKAEAQHNHVSLLPPFKMPAFQPPPELFKGYRQAPQPFDLNLHIRLANVRTSSSSD